jgi:hypothetical protein
MEKYELTGETQENIAKEVFNKLFLLDINGHIEKKNGLSYLSWAWAWAEVKKLYPTANYIIEPYSFDEKLGYMVFTNVTIAGQTYRMWLPVMDNNNYSMKSEPYEVTTKYGKKQVAAASMFDINKAYMRCLVKNLAMFGLGLYIYAGEDLPEKSFETIDEELTVLAATLGKINGCTTVEAVTDIWKNNISLQTNSSFKAAIARKGNELKAGLENNTQDKNK